MQPSAGRRGRGPLAQQAGPGVDGLTRQLHGLGQPLGPRSVGRRLGGRGRRRGRLGSAERLESGASPSASRFRAYATPGIEVQLRLSGDLLGGRGGAAAGEPGPARPWRSTASARRSGVAAGTSAAKVEAIDATTLRKRGVRVGRVTGSASATAGAGGRGRFGAQLDRDPRAGGAIGSTAARVGIGAGAGAGSAIGGRDRDGGDRPGWAASASGRERGRRRRRGAGQARSAGGSGRDGGGVGDVAGDDRRRSSRPAGSVGSSATGATRLDRRLDRNRLSGGAGGDSAAMRRRLAPVVGAAGGSATIDANGTLEFATGRTSP